MDALTAAAMSLSASAMADGGTMMSLSPQTPMARAREENNTVKIDAHFILNYHIHYFEIMSMLIQPVVDKS